MVEASSKLKIELTEDMKAKMKSGDKVGLSTLRLLLADIKNAEIAKRADLSDEEILEAISRSIKRRKESIEQFEKADRDDLVQKEKAELEVLNEYLPPQLSEEELLEIIEAVIEELGASSQKDMGSVMSSVMPKVKGKADGSMISQIVMAKLSG